MAALAAVNKRGGGFASHEEIGLIRHRDRARLGANVTDLPELTQRPSRLGVGEGSEHGLDGGAIETGGDLRKSLDAELDAHAHPLRRNAWKLDAAAGIAEEAFERLTSRQGGR